MANQECEMSSANTSKAFAWFGAINESATAFWRGRNERDRAILIFGSLALALLLVYAIFFGPALSGRAKLSKDLPALRQQAAELQILAKQAADLNNGGVPEADPISQEGIAASLSSRGFKPQNLSVTDDSVRLQLNPVSFANLLDWIDEEQRASRLTVVEASFVSLPQPDTVNATLTLRQQRSEE
jgi:general secretion pathway protein M